MPAWLLPAISAIASIGGSVAANRSNAAQAKKQMDFQADQTSTAAQRAVEDYRKAGLNPALAYDRPAASGSGASAVMGDPVEKGISSARDAYQLRSQLQIAKAQSEADIELKKSQALAVRQQGQQAVEQQALTAAQTRREMQQLIFAQSLFPAQSRQALADALMKEYLLPGARNQSKWDEKTGLLRPIGKDIFSGIRGLSPFFR